MVVSEQIIQVMDALCEKFGVAIDWANETALPYLAMLCDKLVAYEIWTSVAWMAIMIVASIVCAVIAIVKREDLADALEDADFGAMLAYALFIVIWGATTIVICSQVMDIIKCVTFPEMYIFEYIQGLLKPAA